MLFDQWSRAPCSLPRVDSSLVALCGLAWFDKRGQYQLDLVCGKSSVALFEMAGLQKNSERTKGYARRHVTVGHYELVRCQYAIRG